MTRGSPGSTYQSDLDTTIRLARWKRLACTGMPVDQIAADIGITRAALDRMVCRARKHGHPDAVRHPHAATAPGEGVTHVVDSIKRARRVRRRRIGT